MFSHASILIYRLNKSACGHRGRRRSSLFILSTLHCTVRRHDPNKKELFDAENQPIAHPPRYCASLFQRGARPHHDGNNNNKNARFLVRAHTQEIDSKPRNKHPRRGKSFRCSRGGDQPPTPTSALPSLDTSRASTNVRSGPVRSGTSQQQPSARRSQITEKNSRCY